MGCGVQSGEWGVWSVECGLWSVEQAMRRLKCCACHALQHAAPATKNATHLVKTTQKYCACHTKRLSTCCQTGWNVTKCRACHAKRHDNLLGNLRKGDAASPIDTARLEEKQRLETRHVGASKRAFRRRFSYEFPLELENLLPQN